MRFASSTEKEPNSSTTFDEEPKSSRGINTISCVVKRKIQKIIPVVEYNKRGIPHGKAAVKTTNGLNCPKIQRSRFGKLFRWLMLLGKGARSWSYHLPQKNERISTSMKQFILPFTNDKEKLKDTTKIKPFLRRQNELRNTNFLSKKRCSESRWPSDSVRKAIIEKGPIYEEHRSFEMLFTTV
ncbi:hypothetical protein L3X38_037165 [Prunus dulcis]|uniref:Uncharacterized protein n=1 Tax=Prunus dulcis TaxID=3755 RepID=A0AAD4V408_PRUDU|nr:hypothetical protein L3X38_037165 [Prunus dulcis]